MTCGLGHLATRARSHPDYHLNRNSVNYLKSPKQQLTLADEKPAACSSLGRAVSDVQWCGGGVWDRNSDGAGAVSTAGDHRTNPAIRGGHASTGQ